MARIRQDTRKCEDGITRWIVDFDVDGIRRRKKFTSRAAAREYLQQLNAGELPPVPEPAGIMLSDAVERYLSVVTAKKSPGYHHDVVPNVEGASIPRPAETAPRPASKAGGTQYLDQLIFKRFQEFVGDVLLKDVTLADLEAHQTQLHKDKKLQGQTVNRDFTTLCNFFRKCVDWDLIEKNPAAKLKKLPPTNRKARRVLNAEQLRKLFAAARPWLRDILFFILATAVRRSQAIFLRWGSVDFKNRQIHLEASAGFRPKDYEPNTLPLYDDLLAFLERKHAQARKEGRGNPDDLVFVDDRGMPIRPDRLTHEAIKLMRKVLGIESGAVHILRHTSLTMRHRAGVSLDAVRAIAGHSRVTTTQAYLHADNEYLREEMARTPLVSAEWLKLPAPEPRRNPGTRVPKTT